MVKPAVLHIIAVLLTMGSACFGQNPLAMPPAVTGTAFQLDVQNGTKVFYPGTTTPTYGVNGPLLAPTLIVNTGDSISLSVHNGLSVPTTMHWHGLHVAAYNDGGPGQIIVPGATWSPSFVVRNHAGTYWYHPHGAGQTDPQVSKGLAGMLIIHDSLETALGLPHTYGVDDIPLIVQTKAFDILQQIAISTEMDTAIFVNGTLHPYLNVPAQVLRLRLLNASSMRTYNFGWSTNRVFYQIATEGGLIDTPLALTRLRLAPGERAEILVDLQGLAGQQLSLMSYASSLPPGIYGAATVGRQQDTIDGYSANYLNGADYTILQVYVTSPTASPVTAIPISMATYTPYDTDSATVTRYLVFDTLRSSPIDRPNLAAGPFGINARTFSMDSINITTRLHSTEIWVLRNNTYVAHPFHIHDVQFNIIEKSGMATPPAERGWKDVVLVMPGDSAKFITRFETFADPLAPYMYHCHLLHHEDDGMMGSFVVVDPTSAVYEIGSPMKVAEYPNPVTNTLQIRSDLLISDIAVADMSGRMLMSYHDLSATDLQLPTSILPACTYILTVSDRAHHTQHIHFAKVVDH